MRRMTIAVGAASVRKKTSLVTDDSMIRQAIRARLAIAHAGEDAVIVDELKVSRGSSRMDVAVINGLIEGYEIKSDKDTLDRLPRQAEMFGLVVDRMTLVVGERHVEKAKMIVPDWWSIMTSLESDYGELKLTVAKKGRLNRTRDSRALVEMLERDEILAMMSVHGIDKGVRSAAYADLVDSSVKRLSRADISAFVKRMLKLRATLGAEFADKAFGRNAIICSVPSA